MELVKSLCDEGFDFDQTDYRGRTPMHIAAINGDIDLLEFLLSKNVNLDTVDTMGMSPLYLACRWKRSDIVKRLVAAGATIYVS
jgi:ankyrin repeat protein